MAEPSNVAKTAPKKIWLVIGEDCPPEADFTDCDGVTWCQDKIDANSISYIRADVAAAQLAAEVAAAVERAAQVAENYPRADGWIADEIAAAIRTDAEGQHG
jgi:hypothetical protein